MIPSPQLELPQYNRTPPSLVDRRDVERRRCRPVAALVLLWF